MTLIACPAVSALYGRKVIDTWCSASCVCKRCLVLDVKLDYSYTALFVSADVIREAA